MLLDDRATVERLDQEGLLGRIEALPDQCERAWEAAKAFDLPADLANTRQVVVLGMGGSAMAGDIVRSLAALSGRKPVVVARGYDVPRFVDSETLVVACSHSGNTEETLSAFEQATSAGARMVALTTGGELAERAHRQAVPSFEYTYKGEPRSAIGWQLMALLRFAELVGLLPAQGDAVSEAVAAMREQRSMIEFASPASNNPAKQIARRLHGRLPVIVGAGVLTEAAHRWKTQLNENSECWAAYEELPELDHNAVVGFRLPEEVASRAHVVFLWNQDRGPRMMLRYEATAEELLKAGVSNERVDVAGEGPLAQVLSAIYLGDLVSYYLALLNGVAPSPVEAIGRLKARLEDG